MSAVRDMPKRTLVALAVRLVHESRRRRKPGRPARRRRFPPRVLHKSSRRKAFRAGRCFSISSARATRIVAPSAATEAKPAPAAWAKSSTSTRFPTSVDASRAVGVAINLLSDQLKPAYVAEVAADYANDTDVGKEACRD